MSGLDDDQLIMRPDRRVAPKFRKECTSSWHGAARNIGVECFINYLKWQLNDLKNALSYLKPYKLYNKLQPNINAHAKWYLKQKKYNKKSTILGYKLVYLYVKLK